MEDWSSRRMRTLAVLIPPCADPACLDASQDGRFRDPDSFRGLPEGVTDVSPELIRATVQAERLTAG